MRKNFKVAALAGALSMAMSVSVMAAPSDLSFGGWTASNGNVDYNASDVCQNAIYNCTLVASGAGFAQVEVSAADINSDEKYIMTIVTDQDAGGSGGANAAALEFTDVSFIEMKMSMGVAASSNNASGIKAQQRISQLDRGTLFTSTTDINTGWSVAASPIVIDQSLITQGATAAQGDNFDTGFRFESTTAADGKRNGFRMEIDQITGLGPTVGSGSDEGLNVQSFALRERAGTFTTQGGSASLGSGFVDWTAEDDVKAIWVGQKVSWTDENSNVIETDFGYMSYDNLGNLAADGTYTEDTVDAIQAAVLTAAGSAGAWNWDASTFGADAPCLEDPSGANCP